MNKPHVIRLANGSSVACSPANEDTARGFSTVSEGVHILNAQIELSQDRMVAFTAGRAQMKAECLSILESHLISHICPPDTEPNALVIDTAALEEIRRL